MRTAGQALLAHKHQEHQEEREGERPLVSSRTTYRSSRNHAEAGQDPGGGSGPLLMLAQLRRSLQTSSSTLQRRTMSSLYPPIKVRPLLSHLSTWPTPTHSPRHSQPYKTELLPVSDLHRISVKQFGQESVRLPPALTLSARARASSPTADQDRLLPRAAPHRTAGQARPLRPRRPGRRLRRA